MLRKIGRFAAARLQGSKGKRKYDSWMKRNPWASTALTVGDIALAGYAAPKAMAGLKGLLTGGKAAAAAPQAAQAASQLAGNAMPAAGRMASTGLSGQMAAASAPAGLPSGLSAASSLVEPTSRLRQIGGAVARGAGAAGRYVKDNPLPVAMALEGLLTGSQEAQKLRLEREQWRQQQEQQQFLAQLLAPMFAQYYRGE